MASKSKSKQRSLDFFFNAKRARQGGENELNEDLSGTGDGTSSETVQPPSPPPVPVVVDSDPVTVRAVADQVDAHANRLSSDSLSSGSQSQPVVAPAKDISLFIKKEALTPAETRDALLNSWQPTLQFKFPSSTPRNLKFQPAWLREFEWLRYSAVEDGAYCLWCCLFSSSVGCGKGSHERGGYLVKNPFRKWKHAKETFKHHQETGFHADARIGAANFLAVASGAQMPINVQIDSALKREVEENRRRLKPIIETVLFCGRNGLALRGHRETGDITTSTSDSDTRDGNFRELLRFRLKAGDNDLAQHLETASKTAKYTSPQIQNEIIECCRDVILEQLVQEINESKGFAVLADETTDTSKIEQLVVCIRYLKGDEIKEVFLTFVPVTDLRGTSLADTIIQTLVDLKIDIKYMFGQGYDGASAMSSRFQGVQAHVRASAPLAIYVHCSSHSFNLAVSDACSLPVISNCMAVISSAYDFFRFPKRNNELQQAIEKFEQPVAATRLKKLCATRWVERHETVLTLLELLKPAVNALGSVISNWSDRESINTANALLNSLLDGGFLVTLHVVAKVFGLSLPLSRQLQKQNLDLRQAMHLADAVRAEIQELRDNANERFHTLFTEVLTVAKELDVNIEIPRRCGRQLYRVNVATDSPEEYYRIAVFIPFLDAFLLQMDERLLAHRNILECFSAILPDLDTCKAGLSEDNEKQGKILYQTYSAFINCSEAEFISELKLYYRHLSLLGKVPKNTLDALKVCDESVFPAVRVLMKVLALLPVTTATAERSFSNLRYLKNYLRSLCAENRLNGLAHLYIHKDIECTADMVLERMANKSRRIRLKY